MDIRQVELGPMQNFSYLIGDSKTKTCALIDATWGMREMLAIAHREKWNISFIILTHHHFDHVAELSLLAQETKADILIHCADLNDDIRKKAADRKIIPLKGDDFFQIGSLKVKALHTPGHTKGSTCFLIEDKALFTGDTLFQGLCGRCDLPGGDYEEQFHSIRRLASLDPTIRVYSGHNYGEKPVSTIGYECENNPALQAKILDDFYPWRQKRDRSLS